MNWFGKVPLRKTSVKQKSPISNEEFEKLLEYRVEKVRKKLQLLGYEIIKNDTGWKIIGPKDKYLVEQDPYGLWGVRPETEDNYLVRPEKTKIDALELAPARINFRDAIIRLQKIIKEN